MKNSVGIYPFVFFAGLFLTCKTPAGSGQSGIQTSGDNSRNSLDWPGNYRGILPCADCSGIETDISINRGLRFKKKIKYLGKSDSVYESSGTFTWDQDGRSIILEPSGKTEQERWLVGENQLVKLDNNGNRITGDLAKQYVLRKGKESITEKYWKLTELNGKPVKAGEWPKKEPYIVFKTKDNRVTGSGSCNSISGEYDLKADNRITISKMISIHCFQIPKFFL